MDWLHSTGFVIWLTGMRKAGKTTLASQIAQRLGQIGRPALLLDEDGEAKLLIEGLGGSKDDHAVVVKRFGYVARAVARAGGIAVCSALSPYREPREAVRREVRRFVEVFVDAPMETLLQRDGKEALYKRALASEIQGVVGVDLPYEPPAHAELVVRTDQEPVEASVTRVFQALVDNKYIGPTEFGHLTGGQRPKRKPAKPAKGAKPGKAAKPPKAAKAAKAKAGAVVRSAARKAPKKAAARTAKKR
jgi:adenylyl-sulfate kinase